jgi:iron complex outermembrane receptor protein
MLRIYVAFALLSANLSLAQNCLHGYVKDENGKPFQYLTVKIEQSSQSSVTDEFGFYSIKDISPGTYALSVDYRYDIKYFTVPVFSKDSSFDILLERRIEFNEILVSAYQMDVSKYSNATHLEETQLQALDKEKDLPYVLRNVSGIVVQSDAGNGVGYTGIRMRGMDPSHVQININGIPFNDNESSLSYFVDVPDLISSTQEITVIKGNVPNRAGTPSFGGAIDINTNKLSFEPFLRLKTQIGSYHSSKYSLQANSGLLDNKYNFEFGLSRQKSNGYIDRSGSDLKSFRFSGAVIRKNYSMRLNYLHGSEVTGQAWNGLPVQYENADSLRTYNTAGTEKPGSPYEDEKDNYKQDHIQFFYQSQISDRVILNSSINYTHGDGYYENYKQGQDLSQYYIQSPVASTADLVKRQWLQNDFIFANVGLNINSVDHLTLSPSLSYSNYDGDHFGRVSEVYLSEYSFKRGRYYENNGIKKELSLCLKFSYRFSERFSVSVDLQYRNIKDDINGKLEFKDSIQIQKKYQLFNPKLFASFDLNRYWQWYSSIGFMEREPFREDLLNGEGDLKPEQLFDIEAGFKFNKKKAGLKVNGYFMNYRRQLALSGKLNNVGEALHVNLDRSYRLGFEFEGNYNISNSVTVWNASNFSLNRIPEIKESIPIIDSLYNLLGYEELAHKNSTISYSPGAVMQSGIKLKILSEGKKLPEVSFGLNHYYVSGFYIDNYSSVSGFLKGYHNLECTFAAHKSFQGLGTLNFWVTIYNLLDAKYISHGWISKFNSEYSFDLNSDPYLASDTKDHYYYKGLFPQALRHLSLGISFDFH